MKPRRDIPDRREFLSDSAHRLAIAEQRADTKGRRRRLLVLAFVFLALAALTAAAFWLVNSQP